MSATAEFMSQAMPAMPPQAIFDNDPQAAANEMLAATAPGGVIHLEVPVPGSLLARVHELINHYLPASQAVPETRFVGTRESLNALFEHQAIAMGAFDGSSKLRFASAEHWLAAWQSSYGPLRRAYRLVDPEWRGQMSEDLIRIARRFCAIDAEGPYLRYDYLEFNVHKGPQL